MLYLILKYAHVVAAVTTISGFVLRGYWMLVDSKKLQHPVTKIAPHIIDTVFLLAGIGLIWLLHLEPLKHPWLIAKFTGLVVYVLLGTVAIRRGPTKQIRTIAFASAVAVFAYIVGVALTRSPLSWLSF
ncbi:MAG: SirB2 family protein [Gammaproteobacteria bacterium]|nr:SirB2 family protein [Gammaproteobacteria bacterium]MDH3778818.1 SirB2 family protein [Gammaproteobacteria bacterium]MDH3810987.1 SirB2 family protein [Gammaproteobacteria bacterium]